MGLTPATEGEQMDAGLADSLVQQAVLDCAALHFSGDERRIRLAVLQRRVRSMCLYRTGPLFPPIWPTSTRNWGFESRLPVSTGGCPWPAASRSASWGGDSPGCMGRIRRTLRSQKQPGRSKPRLPSHVDSLDVPMPTRTVSRSTFSSWTTPTSGSGGAWQGCWTARK